MNTSPQNSALSFNVSDEPPPGYEDVLETIHILRNGFHAHAQIIDDGRVQISLDGNQRRLSSMLTPSLADHVRQANESKHKHDSYPCLPSNSVNGQAEPPSLNVVMHVVGSRGDVQPFLALGRHLQEMYKHRVRIATHLTFRSFVEENGLEFYNIGGDPTVFMAYMVKNPGLMPKMHAFKSGDVNRRQKEMFEIMEGCWRSCFDAGDNVAASELTEASVILPNSHLVLSGSRKRTFVANVIIANPPSFAHIHCAQKLGIPLHLMFTMPWSPTQAFPHPLANIQPSNVDPSLKNLMSYPLVETIIWQGLGKVINRFRSKILDMEPVDILWGQKGIANLQIPHTYCWSPALIPKPDDWGTHISVAGFYHLPPVSNYIPDPLLEAFLRAGPPPVYFGFGSIVVDDPGHLSDLILEAIRQTDHRAVISSGWGGFGRRTVPDTVFVVGNIPHDWLFARVSCVVHHGGAGTAAAGIRLGKPTIVVPFFGDQFFWGSVIAGAGAGPSPIPIRDLTASKLAVALQAALKPTTRRQAQQLEERIMRENGTHVGAVTFHQHLNLDNLRCILEPSRCAVWKLKKTGIRLSAFSATALIDASIIQYKDLELYRPQEQNIKGGPWDPVTGVTSAVLGMVGNMLLGLSDLPKEITRARKVKAKTPSSSDASDVTQWNKNLALSTTTARNTDSSRSEHDILSATASNESPLHNFSRSTPAAGEASYAPVSSSDQAVPYITLPATTPKPPYTDKTSRKDQSQAIMKNTIQVSTGIAIGTAKGVGRILLAGFKSPFAVTTGAAKGFHSAPKLYGDQTVRPPERITGILSGVRAGGLELGFGLYDGVTGLWTQPADGLEREGLAGLCKGLGKGVAGLVLKPVAGEKLFILRNRGPDSSLSGVWGLPGFAFEGIDKQVQRLFTTTIKHQIVVALKLQGIEEFKEAGNDEKRVIIDRWASPEIEVLKKRLG